MPNINFTCPHCSYTTQLASSTEGVKGNCPSCKTAVVITPDNPESKWLVTSSGLNSVTPEKFNEQELIALIRDKTVAGGAQLLDLSKPSGEWVSLKDSHFFQYVKEAKSISQRRREIAKEEKHRQREQTKEARLEQKREENEKIQQREEKRRKREKRAAESKLREDRNKRRIEREQDAKRDIELSTSEIALLKAILATNLESAKRLKTIEFYLAFIFMVIVFGFIGAIVSMIANPAIRHLF